LKLSPPSFEFAGTFKKLYKCVALLDKSRLIHILVTDGLYVLLRPEKKKKNNVDRPEPPTHLHHLLMTNVPAETCPWSLSGPQFPQPTAIQQRYAYPKGRVEYSSRKGAALWTMYGADGREDQEYRLLHVYFSAKRAVNRGMSVEGDFLPMESPTKRAKRSPTRNEPDLPFFRNVRHQQSPAITASSVSHSSFCGSPLSFDTLPPSPTHASYEYEHLLRSTPPPFVTPMFRRSPLDPLDAPSGFLTPSPFRPASSLSVHQTEIERKDSEPFPYCDIDKSMEEIDSYWNDPLLSIMLKPSQDAEACTTQAAPGPVRSFQARLETLQESFREIIFAASDSEQPVLVSLLASWARQVARDPLTSLHAVVSAEDDSTTSTSPTVEV
jgi:hypothetical protein